MIINGKLLRDLGDPLELNFNDRLPFLAVRWKLLSRPQIEKCQEVIVAFNLAFTSRGVPLMHFPDFTGLLVCSFPGHYDVYATCMTYNENQFNALMDWLRQQAIPDNCPDLSGWLNRGVEALGLIERSPAPNCRAPLVYRWRCALGLSGVEHEAEMGIAMQQSADILGLRELYHQFWLNEDEEKGEV